MDPLSLPLAEFSAADFEKQGRLLRAISPFSRGIVVRRPLFSSPAVNIQDSFFTSLMRSFSRCFATLCCLLGRKYALRIHLYGSRILSFCADAVKGKCKVKLEQFYFFFTKWLRELRRLIFKLLGAENFLYIFVEFIVDCFLNVKRLVRFSTETIGINYKLRNV